MSEKIKYMLNAGAIIGIANGIFASFSVILLPVGLYIATKRYRKVYMNDSITYSESFRFGYTLSALAGVVIAFFNYLRFVFYPDQIVNSFNETMALMKSLGYSEVTIKTVSEALTPEMFGVSTFFSIVLMGFLLSLIFAFFLKKEPTITEQS